MGTKILKIAAGAVVLATGALTAKYGVSMKVEKKQEVEKTKEETKGHSVLDENGSIDENNFVESLRKEILEDEAKEQSKKAPRKGGKKWRKAQAEQNK